MTEPKWIFVPIADAATALPQQTRRRRRRLPLTRSEIFFSVLVAVEVIAVLAYAVPFWIDLFQVWRLVEAFR